MQRMAMGENMYVYAVYLNMRMSDDATSMHVYMEECERGMSHHVDILKFLFRVSNLLLLS